MIAKNNNKTTIMIVIINRFNQNVKIYKKFAERICCALLIIGMQIVFMVIISLQVTVKW